MSEPIDTVAGVPRIPWWSLRGIGLRVASVAVGLSPFVVLESVLWVSGVGQAVVAKDPYVGFVDVSPLFVHDTDTDRYSIPRDRELFQPDSFPAIKAPGTSRIFCLGGSTVQGRPYGIETAFSTWLRIALEEADPARNWEVINCGGISYASYRLGPIMEELLMYSPDLFVLYTGHNEFLEDRTYHEVKQAPLWVARAHRVLCGLRSYNAARSWFVEDAVASPEWKPKGVSVLASEVEALLDYRGGLDAYKRDPAWRRGVARHFEFNLRRMVMMAHNAGVPLMLVNPVSNLRDTPPFKVLHREGITDAERDRFELLRNEAGSMDLGLDRRITLLQDAIAIDGQHAGVHFQLGKLFEASGQMDLAKRAYLAAREHDICPLRITEPLHAVLERVAEGVGVYWLDARRLFARLTEDSIPGNDWLVDHVHPSIRGHQRLALELCEALVERGFVSARAGWEARLEGRNRQHLADLDPVYYVKGRQQLEGLRMWSQGRSNKARPPARIK